eukprot:PhM_4_TR7783/c0_g1_i1/m.94538
MYSGGGSGGSMQYNHCFMFALMFSLSFIVIGLILMIAFFDRDDVLGVALFLMVFGAIATLFLCMRQCQKMKMDTIRGGANMRGPVIARSAVPTMAVGVGISAPPSFNPSVNAIGGGGVIGGAASPHKIVNPNAQFVQMAPNSYAVAMPMDNGSSQRNGDWGGYVDASPTNASASAAFQGNNPFPPHPPLYEAPVNYAPSTYGGGGSARRNQSSSE